MHPETRAIIAQSHRIQERNERMQRRRATLHQDARRERRDLNEQS
jgi:hypothetical protein